MDLVSAFLAGFMIGFMVCGVSLLWKARGYLDRAYELGKETGLDLCEKNAAFHRWATDETEPVIIDVPGPLASQHTGKEVVDGSTP